MSQIKTINPYNSTEWRTQFPVIFKNLINEHEHVIYTYQEMNVLKASLHHIVYELPHVVLNKFKILNALPYYYIQWLLEKNPNVILDVGCGSNPFEILFPNIIGLDDHSNGPKHHSDKALTCHVDQEFTMAHEQMCDALISVNAIHFSPIWTIKSRLLDLARLLRPGGRAFVSFNAETWLMSTPREELQQHFGLYPDINSLLEYMYQSVKDSGLTLLVSDWPVCEVSEHSPIRDDLNGNIRLVFEVDNQRP